MSAEELNDLKPVVVELKEADPVKEVEKKSSFWKRICFCCCPRRSNRRNSKALEMKRLEETKPEEGTTKPDEGTNEKATNKPDEGTTKPDEGTNEKATTKPDEGTNEKATNKPEEATNEEGTNEEATADEVNAGIAHSSKSVVVFEADNPKTWPGFAEALEIIQKRQSTATNAKKKNASFYKNKKKNKNQKNQTNGSSEALSETPLSETPLSEALSETPLSEALSETPLSEALSETPLSEALSEPPLSPEYVVVSPQNRPMKQQKK